MGFLVDDEEDALMWRGLMLNRAVQHFLEDVAWGDLDYLLIDMPPGTGDVQMGLARMLPRAEMIVVTTPAVSAQKVAIRAATMARKSFLRIVGVIENMSSFRVRPRRGVRACSAPAAARRWPATPVCRCSAGSRSSRRSPPAATPAQPVALGDGPAAEAFRAIADLIVDEAVPPVAMAGCSARMLDAAVAALDARMRQRPPPTDRSSPSHAFRRRNIALSEGEFVTPNRGISGQRALPPRTPPPPWPPPGAPGEPGAGRAARRGR